MAKTASGRGNTSTMKKYGDNMPEPVDKSNAPLFADQGNKPAQYKGNIDGANLGPLSQPMNKGINANIRDLGGLHNDIGEMSGFVTDGYLDKQGAHFGEAAKFNYLPPGMDISNQMNAEINEMPMRLVTDISYPGDGWMPAPRDIKE